MDLNQRKDHLEVVRGKLKTEFFGIDHCIDNVIESIKTWYLMPELVTRPIVVGLWGMTGVGKTALVRSLVRHLGQTSRFVEIQMDAHSEGGAFDEKSICSILRGSSIEEGTQGIVLLDEFQRFRTVDQMGMDVKVERYADVWMLLSDGKFPSNYNALVRMEENMMMWDYYDDQYEAQVAEQEAQREKPPEEPKFYREIKYVRKFKTDYSDASKLKDVLRYKESVYEIMAWSKQKTRDILRKAIADKNIPPIDYSKCLVFVSGNLDEAFKMADNVEDCDTSADIYHEYTKKIGSVEIKQALLSRFKPEQIARLGNNHIVYPSLSAFAYMSIIKRSCREYTEQATAVFNVGFEIDESVYKEIYENSVYPTQGTRPVFTSIHKLFGSPLADAIFWAREYKADFLKVTLDISDTSLIFSWRDKTCRIKVDLEIRARRAKYSDDYNALVAVHEAGHAIIYAELFKVAPVEVAISVASFKGGYNRFSTEHLSKEETLSRITVGMGGIAAEEIIFGPEMRSTGCGSDVHNSTSLAAEYVRRYAMDGFNSYITDENRSALANNDMAGSNSNIEALMKTQRDAALTIITKHRKLLIDLSNELVKVRKMTGSDFVTFLDGRIVGVVADNKRDINGDYAARLAKLS